MTVFETIRCARKNSWIIAAIVFFVIFKFWLIGVMWDGRSIPPEPDDTYQYVAHIASVIDCPSIIFCPYPGVSMSDHTGVTYLSYRTLLGLVGTITGYSPEAIFKASFYAGTVLLAIVLIAFVSSFTKDKKLIAWSLLFLSFYHGTGESHGFFWVVPSFFSMLLFFILVVFIERKGWKNPFHWWLMIPIVFLYVFSHPISEYLVLILPLYGLIRFFITRKKDWELWKKIIYVLALVFLAYLLQSEYLTFISQKNYYGVQESIIQARSAVSNLLPASDKLAESTEQSPESWYSITASKYMGFLGQRVNTLNAVYFRWIFPHWLATLPFVLVLWILYKEKQYPLLSLYFSSFFFFIIATFLNEFGFRSAIILWPLTYLMYGMGSWYVLGYLKEVRLAIPRYILVSFFGVGIMGFFLLNTLFAFVFNSNINERNNYFIDESFSTYLIKHSSPETTISLPSDAIRTKGGATVFFRNGQASLSEHPDYIVLRDQQESMNINTDRDSWWNQLVSSITSLFGFRQANQDQPRKSEVPQGYFLEKKFGPMKIYRKNTR